MLNYLYKNKVLSINVLVSTLTAYMLLGLLDDCIIPNIQYILKYNRFCMKLFVWIFVIVICSLLEIKIN